MLTRWVSRLIGVVSTIILARLLTPADFGLVAMASIVVGFVRVLTSFGVGTVLVQRNTQERSYMDSAWTLGLLETAFAGALIFGSGSIAASYFHDQRVVDVMRLMALTVSLSGLRNIGLVTFYQNMEFGKEFQVLFITRITGFAVTVFLAWMLRSYWAMPIGALCSEIMGVVVSYIIHPYRPRLSLSKAGDIFSFSQWLMVANIGRYIDSRIDQLVLGGRVSAESLGLYSAANDIASTPTSDFLAPLNRVLFPKFVQFQNSPAVLQDAFTMALSILALIALPIATGIALTAPLFVPLLLGPRWVDAVTLLAYSPSLALYTLSHLPVATFCLPKEGPR